MMSSHAAPSASEPLIQISPLDQYVPSRACAVCDVCCRFPEAESFLRPYFARDEVRAAVRRGIPATAFPEPGGSHVRLVPHPEGDGYLCPAFDPRSSQCRIYEDRPFDCQLYPLAVMWDARLQEVVLGWDSKCPYLCGTPAPEFRRRDLAAYAAQVALTLEREPRLTFFERNPKLIGRYQEDVVVVQPLPRVTARVRGAWKDGPVFPLVHADRARFEDAASVMAPPGLDCPSAWAFANHYLWTDTLAYSWAQVEEHFCLSVDTPDGRFMPVPPLGKGPPPHLLAAVFAQLRAGARGQGVARIDNVPRSLAEQWSRWGYRVVSKDPEYVYRTEPLIVLRGDQYKSQRAACNRVSREHDVRIEAFNGTQTEACRQLFAEWQRQKRAVDPRSWAELLLRDATGFHRRLLTDALSLGLTGWVAVVDGRVRGYTFGTALTRELFCVIAEVADRTIAGLAEWLFREGARHAGENGFAYLNTMDATGLPLLARSKHFYHPVGLIHPYTVYES